MTVKLSPEQEEALKRHGHRPVHVVDHSGQVAYVLVPADDYERIRPLLESDEFDIRETYLLQEEVARAEGWEDPVMDDYDDYDTRRRPT